MSREREREKRMEKWKWVECGVWREEREEANIWYRKIIILIV